MNDTCTYLIHLRGRMDKDEINAVGPLQVTVEWIGTAETALTACTDQSGLIGLMRYLHGLGFVFLSVSRTEQPDPDLANWPGSR